MRHFLASIVVAAALVATSPSTAAGDIGVGLGGDVPGTSSNFEVVGHNPLFGRGMNAAHAVFESEDGTQTFAYVGNRTDGLPHHEHPGILVVDASDPASPTVVNEIGPPFAGNIGETTRELRVWWEKKLLIVLSFACSARLHDCAAADDVRLPPDGVTPTYRFFDISDPANPVHKMTYVPTQRDGRVRTPHEFYLWVDPKDDDRALLWSSTPTNSLDPNQANLIIYDISGVPAGFPPQPVSQGNWNHLYEGAPPAQYDFNLRVHSMGVNATGTLTNLAYLRGTYLQLDTWSVAHWNPEDGADLSDDLLTPPPNRPRWGLSPYNCTKNAEGCAEAHSAVQVPGPGKPYVVMTDEVYGTYTDPDHGCPWGWLRMVDVSEPEQPVIVGEYRQRRNSCAQTTPAEDEFTSYASHNPTVFTPLVMATWHSAGLQAIDIADPKRPEQAGWFSPEPLPAVATEDPALGRGPNKVIMWSYPIIEDGLIYVIDIRNGLYVLKYTGPHRGVIQGTKFNEGNSNLGEIGNLRNYDPGSGR